MSGLIPIKLAVQAMANLEAENARLNLLFANSEQENASLKAEADRLRKAGDALREALEKGPIAYQCRIDRWKAAKEGKPSV